MPTTIPHYCAAKGNFAPTSKTTNLSDRDFESFAPGDGRISFGRRRSFFRPAESFLSPEGKGESVPAVAKNCSLFLSISPQMLFLLQLHQKRLRKCVFLRFFKKKHVFYLNLYRLFENFVYFCIRKKIHKDTTYNCVKQ